MALFIVFNGGYDCFENRFVASRDLTRLGRRGVKGHHWPPLTSRAPSSAVLSSTGSLIVAFGVWVAINKNDELARKLI